MSCTVRTAKLRTRPAAGLDAVDPERRPNLTQTSVSTAPLPALFCAKIIRPCATLAAGTTCSGAPPPRTPWLRRGGCPAPLHELALALPRLMSAFHVH